MTLLKRLWQRALVHLFPHLRRMTAEPVRAKQANNMLASAITDLTNAIEGHTK